MGYAKNTEKKKKKSSRIILFFNVCRGVGQSVLLVFEMGLSSELSRFFYTDRPLKIAP